MRTFFIVAVTVFVAVPFFPHARSQRSGYLISNVRYQIEGTLVSAVTFRLSPANAHHVSVRLGGRKVVCAVAAGLATCTLPEPAPISSLTHLETTAYA
jgi:hypothetical protein